VHLVTALSISRSLRAPGAAGCDAQSGDEHTVRERRTRRDSRARTATSARLSRPDIRAHDLTFGIGPAGTGKTYLAVACAVEALQA
jgi:phosphate starvation-inducible PhoH-like protein